MTDFEDWRQIFDVINRYAEALDSRDWPMLDEVFTDDVVGEYGLGPVEGRPALVEMIRSFLDGCGPSQHLLGNHRISVDGEVATSTTRVRVFHLGAGDRADLEPFENWGEYRDELRRTASGWRICRRTLDISIVRGDPAVLGTG